MPKLKTLFCCQHCDAQYPKWQGQCAECQKWNTLVNDVVEPPAANPRATGYTGVQSQPTKLSEVALHSQVRLATGLAEFDHVLGGGLVSDSVVLIGGAPGIGKSTLLLQVLCQIAKHYPALYVTGEESLQQVASRAKRLDLDPDKLILLAETHVERIIALAEKHQPKVMVVDSIQTIYTDAVSSAPGGVGQVRESAARLVQYAKQKGLALFFSGHVTKEGAIAGPRVLEHMVDTVLYFEGDSHQRYRVIRAVKNRFGAVNELGVFGMTDKGLKQVSNPSAIFLSRYQADVSGSVVMVSWEGSRPLLVEIQALVDESHLANPRRVTVGLDHNRMAMLLAILHRHAGVATYDQDVFVNAVGGLRITETGSDLAVIMAVLSSLKNRPIPTDEVVFGEVGLSGEIRPVPGGQERLKEVQKHGFKRAIIPKANAPKFAVPGLEVIAIEKLSELLKYM
jgi:DNA repair protein RadA/Sms